MSINIGLIGAAGRMGKNIIEIISKDSQLKLFAAIDSKDSKYLGIPAYEVAGIGRDGIKLSSNINEVQGADVIIDFTEAKVTMNNLEDYKRLQIPLVIGSTGFTPKEKDLINKLSSKLPLLLSPNMSLGVNTAFKLIEMAAKYLNGYDIEIFETHHRLKKDAPSGTAIAMSEAAAKGAGLNLIDSAIYCRHGLIGERKDNEIGIQTLRGGDVIGDHTVFFFGNGERLEITHRAHTRSTFAKGAVVAAKYIYNKTPKLYTMKDILNI